MKSEIYESLLEIKKKLEKWPKWKIESCGIESDYSITNIFIQDE
jgi:hypothetical protein